MIQSRSAATWIRKKQSACLGERNILLSEKIAIQQLCIKSACHMSLVLLSPTHFLLLLLFNSWIDEESCKAHFVSRLLLKDFSLPPLKEGSVTNYHGDCWTYINFLKKKPNILNVVKVLVYQISIYNINFAFLRLTHVILFSVFICEKGKVSITQKLWTAFAWAFNLRSMTISDPLDVGTAQWDLCRDCRKC